MYAPVVYSGIMAFTLYIYDAPNKLFKDNNKKYSISEIRKHNRLWQTSSLNMARIVYDVKGDK